VSSVWLCRKYSSCSSHASKSYLICLIPQRSLVGPYVVSLIHLRELVDLRVHLLVEHTVSGAGHALTAGHLVDT